MQWIRELRARISFWRYRRALDHYRRVQDQEHARAMSDMDLEWMARHGVPQGFRTACQKEAARRGLPLIRKEPADA
jgi:hypothetical protein